MKASIKLEAIGYNHNQESKLFEKRLDECCDGLGKYMTERTGNYPWIAEITGTHEKFKFERKFIKYRTDYSEANGAFSRGVYQCYIVESGRLYELKNLVSWNSYERYFFIVSENGDIEKKTESEAMEWIKNT